MKCTKQTDRQLFCSRGKVKEWDPAHVTKGQLSSQIRMEVSAFFDKTFYSLVLFVFRENAGFEQIKSISILAKMPISRNNITHFESRQMNKFH
jgi:hypothetical protein